MTRILVADDEPDVRESTQMLLEVLGYEVSSVADAAEILTEALRTQPDILLQDVFMPGLDLDRLAAAVRAEPALSKMRIVVFTASVEADEIRERIHADGVLRKPFDADRVRSILDRIAGVTP